VTPLRAALCLALIGAAPRTARAEERDEPEWHQEASPDVFYVSPTGEGGVTHIVFRIVGDVTGDPIPGATAAIHAQTEHPVTGLVAADRTEGADEEGWVRIRVDDLGWTPSWASPYWTYVEAPGHAGLAVTDGRVDGVLRLDRARTHVVEVRDAFDRPVAGAVVGARSARTCGHMPDQRVAVTDLHGRAVLGNLGVDGADEDSMGWECWVLAETISATYHDLAVSARRRPPQVLRHGPSEPIEGTVLEPDGTPAVGIHVGTLSGGHRGPWTKTGPGGHFRLVGADALVETIAARDGEHWSHRVEFTAPPHGVRRIVRLPPRGEEPEAEPFVRDVEVTLRDVASGDEVAPRDARLVAVRDGDGMTSRVGSSLRLPRGRWTLRAGGGVTPYAPARAEVEVPDGEGDRLSVALDLTRHPPFRFRIGGDPTEAVAWLVSANEERLLSEEEIASGTVHVPLDEPCAFRVHRKEGEDVAFVPVPAGPRAPDAPPLVLRAPKPLVVSAVLAKPDGTPVAGWLHADVDGILDARSLPDWDPETPPSARPEASLPAGPRVEALAVPEDRRLGPRLVGAIVTTETRAAGRLDLGTIRLDDVGDRRLTVVDSRGAVIAPAGVRIVRDGFVREWRAHWERPFDTFLAPLEDGDVVEIDLPEGEDEPAPVLARPIRRRLEGPGPWTIRAEYAKTSIVLEATDEDGRPLDALLVIDGAPYEGAWFDDDGVRHALVVSGLAPGPHRVAVSAENRLTHLYRVVLKEGERRVLAPRMRPLPARDETEPPR
jgi:hypothetical protein